LGVLWMWNYFLGKITLTSPQFFLNIIYTPSIFTQIKDLPYLCEKLTRTPPLPNFRLLTENMNLFLPNLFILTECFTRTEESRFKRMHKPKIYGVLLTLTASMIILITLMFPLFQIQWQHISFSSTKKPTL
jgi:hypothetical protein